MGQRWFAGKGRVVDGVELLDATRIPGADEGVLAIVEVRYTDGGRERYALPGRPERGGALSEPAPQDPLWPALARVMVEGGELEGVTGTFAARTAGGGAVSRNARRLTADQSNTSVVLGERLVLKCYRRLERGTHPEPEALEALSAAGSGAAPRWHATLVHGDDGDAHGTTALAVVYAYVPGEPIGWEPAIEGLRERLAQGADGDDLLATATALGSAAAELHRSLAHAFGTSVADAGAARQAHEAALATLAAALDTLSGDDAADVGRRAAAALQGLEALAGTTVGRLHGDLHVAQFVRSPTGLVVVDFEGEPDSPLAERRRPRPPLRDLACLLLSLDHVAAAAARRLGFGEATERAFRWSAQARERVLAAYGGEVEPRFLRALEIEKECRELLYAARVLPEWLYAPRLVLPRLLEVAA